MLALVRFQQGYQSLGFREQRIRKESRQVNSFFSLSSPLSLSLCLRWHAWIFTAEVLGLKKFESLYTFTEVLQGLGLSE